MLPTYGMLGTWLGNGHSHEKKRNNLPPSAGAAGRRRQHARAACVGPSRSPARRSITVRLDQLQHADAGPRRQRQLGGDCCCCHHHSSVRCGLYRARAPAGPAAGPSTATLCGVQLANPGHTCRKTYPYGTLLSTAGTGITRIDFMKCMYTLIFNCMYISTSYYRVLVQELRVFGPHAPSQARRP